MINYLLAGLLGLLFVTLSKASSMKKDFEVANETFVFKKFLTNEAYAICMSIIVILLMAITINEWVDIKPQIANYVTIIFAMGGAIGSWAFLLLLGKSKKYIRKMVDEKTNELDAMKANDNGKN